MKIKEFLNKKRKKSTFYTIEFKDAQYKTFYEISNLFVKENVNTIIFLDNNKPYYILTPSDVIDILINHKDIITIKEYVEQNQKNIITIDENKTLFEAYKVMRNFNIRHLIIVDYKSEFLDIMNFEEFTDYLAEIALRDDLTKLYNRRFFEFILDKYKIEDKDIEKGIIFIDLDNFKPINDKYGHHIGDKVLQIVAKTIEDSIRDIDYSFRIGGDEFVILVFSNKEILKKVANRLCKNINNINIDGIKIGCSIGYAHYPSDSKNFSEVIKIADKRMYENKKKKKN